ncbi:di-trans,poly-cis-decaprenylcistransferase [archaeon]|nr:di-trans,poly-cis-decaprenylcistransferase [archaeon]
MIPDHLAVILDGNRRFAKQMLKAPWIGHKYGLEKTRQVLQWTCEAGIKYMTAYVLSLENISTRPKKELKMILNYLDQETENVLGNKDHTVHRFKIKVRFIGRLHILPKALQKKMAAVEEMTKKYKDHFLNIAVAYGGQQEIVDATKRILIKGLGGAIKPSDIDEKLIKAHLYTNGQPYPDMVFRTGGEKRLSNFLPFQTAYSELIFTDTTWPSLTKKDFDNALKEFGKRKRRFGK